LGVGGHLGFCKISFLTPESYRAYRDGARSTIWCQSDVYFRSYSTLYENPRWRRRPSCFQNFRILSISLVAAAVLMLHTKFGEDRPFRSEIISIFVSHW